MGTEVHTHAQQQKDSRPEQRGHQLLRLLRDVFGWRKRDLFGLVVDHSLQANRRVSATNIAVGDTLTILMNGTIDDLARNFHLRNNRVVTHIGKRQ